jgi:hypothetical protein
MSSTEENKEKEGRALDALIVAAFKQDNCDVDEAQVESLKKSMSAEDQAALDRALGPNFIDSLFAGSVRPRDKQVRGALQSAMNRSEKDEEEPPSAKAQEEMERKIREEEARRKAQDERL